MIRACQFRIEQKPKKVIKMDGMVWAVKLHLSSTPKKKKEKLTRDIACTSLDPLSTCPYSARAYIYIYICNFDTIFEQKYK